MEARIFNRNSGSWHIQVQPTTPEEEQLFLALGTKVLYAKMVGAMLVVETKGESNYTHA